MPSVKDYAKDLCGYLETITGFPAILTGTNGPQPTTAYLAVQVYTTEMLDYDISWEEIREALDENDQPIVGETQMWHVMRGLAKVTYHITCWDGPDPMRVLTKYNSSLWSAFFPDKLPDFGLSNQSIITEFETGEETVFRQGVSDQSRIVRRAQMYSSFYLALSEEFAIDSYDTNQLVVRTKDEVYITVDIPKTEDPCP